MGRRGRRVLGASQSTSNLNASPMINSPIAAVANVFTSDWFTAAASVSGWAFFGVVLCVAALKLFDLITPGKLEVQVFKDGNTAAAIVYGAALLASAIIIASAMH